MSASLSSSSGQYSSQEKYHDLQAGGHLNQHHHNHHLNHHHHHHLFQGQAQAITNCHQAPSNNHITHQYRRSSSKLNSFIPQHSISNDDTQAFEDSTLAASMNAGGDYFQQQQHHLANYSLQHQQHDVVSMDSNGADEGSYGALSHSNAPSVAHNANCCATNHVNQPYDQLELPLELAAQQSSAYQQEQAQIYQHQSHLLTQPQAHLQVQQAQSRLLQQHQPLNHNSQTTQQHEIQKQSYKSLMMQQSSLAASAAEAQIAPPLQLQPQPLPPNPSHVQTSFITNRDPGVDHQDQILHEPQLQQQQRHQDNYQSYNYHYLASRPRNQQNRHFFRLKSNGSLPVEAQYYESISQDLASLMRRCEAIDVEIKKCQELQEELNCATASYNRTFNNIKRSLALAQAQKNSALIEKLENDYTTTSLALRRQTNLINSVRYSITSSQRDVLSKISTVRDNILENLKIWRQSQQNQNNTNAASTQIITSSGNDSCSPVSQSLTSGPQGTIQPLDLIEYQVKLSVDIAYSLKKQNSDLHHQFSQLNLGFEVEELRKLRLAIDRFLESLVLSTFIVERQPPQVMKTNTRFVSSVRFMAGTRMNIGLTSPQIKVSIMSEANARALFERQDQLIRSSWQGFDQYYPVSESLKKFSNQSLQELRGQSTSPQGSTQEQFMTGQEFTSFGQQVETVEQVDYPMVIDLQQQKQQQEQQQQYNANSMYQNESDMNLKGQQEDKSPKHFFPRNFKQDLINEPPNSKAKIFKTGETKQSRFSDTVCSPMSCRDKKVVDLGQFEVSGDILNNLNPLEYQEQIDQVTSSFRNMQLKKIKRTEKRGTESVMDEKLILLFHTELKVVATEVDSQGNSRVIDHYYQIIAGSLPVVVIVHGNQEPHAWATVIWHNAFAKLDNIMYQVPDKVPWRELGLVLSEKMRASAGKGLSEQNLEYLTKKISRGAASDSNYLVSWNQFSKEPLPDKPFTFWEWFYSIHKLTKEHLKDLWREDKIFGFVGKEDCIKLLSNAYHAGDVELGTFLMRFSETDLGGIAIAWVSNEERNRRASLSGRSYQGSVSSILLRRNQPSPTNSVASSTLSRISTSSICVNHLQPLCNKDLGMRPLVDRLRDLQELQYLYPTIPKDEAFAQYYTPLEDAALMANGYLRPMLVQVLVSDYARDAGFSRGSSSSPAGLLQRPISGSGQSPASSTQDSSAYKGSGVINLLTSDMSMVEF